MLAGWYSFNTPPLELFYGAYASILIIQNPYYSQIFSVSLNKALFQDYRFDYHDSFQVCNYATIKVVISRLPAYFN